jgi:hypothetical protein
VAFLNRDHGVNIRGGGENGRDEAYQSCMRDSLAWGNGLADFKIKTGYDHIHFAQRCVGLGTLSNTGNPAPSGNVLPDRTQVCERRSGYTK